MNPKPISTIIYVISIQFFSNIVLMRSLLALKLVTIRSFFCTNGCKSTANSFEDKVEVQLTYVVKPTISAFKTTTYASKLTIH